LLEHNLGSLFHILEYCKRTRAGLILLSTSRVYSIAQLANLPLRDTGDAFALDEAAQLPRGASAQGIGPDFSTESPISLYGSTKLACEVLSLEYGQAFDFPVWVNRCGVLTGPGQFGTPEQGIFAFWVNAHLRRHPLRYIGFDGKGKQVRDALHPADLADLLIAQMREPRNGGKRLYTIGGGLANAMSLAQLTAWCNDRFECYQPASDCTPRRYDTPWIVMDAAQAQNDFAWVPKIHLLDTLSQIADHAEQHPDWLKRSGV
jgi:CDP-paratose 2-epimerase